MRPVYVQGMWGLGDNIYQRPFVERLARRARVFLDTPWPELFEDFDVRFVRGQRNLRTQLKNIQRQHPGRWAPPPPRIPPMRIHYSLNNASIIAEMAHCFGETEQVILSLPAAKEAWLVKPATAGTSVFPQPRPIALVRPVTVRTEWLNAARNPLPEYVHQVAEWLMPSHHVIVVADLAPGQETLVGNMPPHHDAYLQGELTVDRLLALVASADVIVGGVGWLVPAAVAAGKRAFVVLGGQGGHNAPEKILAPWWGHKLTFAQPDRFCRCNNMRHNCEKTISNLPQAFSRFIGQEVS